MKDIVKEGRIIDCFSQAFFSDGSRNVELDHSSMLYKGGEGDIEQQRPTSGSPKNSTIVFWSFRKKDSEAICEL